MSDIIQEIRSGNKDAVKSVYQQYAKDVYSFAKSITGDHDTALAATKKTFLTLFRNIQQGEEPQNLRTAALKIAYDEAYKMAAPSAEEAAAPEPTVQEEAQPEAAPEPQEKPELNVAPVFPEQGTHYAEQEPAAYDAPQEETYEEPAYDAPQAETYEEPAYDAPQEGTYGEPAYDAPQEGTYGEPVYDAPQEGTYGEPVYDAPQEGTYGEPVYDAPQEGTYGEPAYDAPQDDTYGEPAYDAPQDDTYGEPAYDAPQDDTYGEPAYDAPQDDTYGEPAYDVPQDGAYEDHPYEDTYGNDTYAAPEPAADYGDAPQPAAFEETLKIEPVSVEEEQAEMRDRRGVVPYPTPQSSDPAPQSSAYPETGARDGMDVYALDGEKDKYDAYDYYDSDADQKPRSKGLFVFCIILNIVLIVILLWFLGGLLVNLGVLPDIDIGYSWFNAHIYPLF